MLSQIPDTLAVILVPHNRVGVTTVVECLNSGEEFIKVGTISGRFGRSECVQRADVAQFVEFGDLRLTQGPGPFHGRRKKRDFFFLFHRSPKLNAAAHGSLRWFMTKSEVALGYCVGIKTIRPMV